MRQKVKEHGKISDLTYIDIFKKCTRDNGEHTETDLKIFCYLVSKMQEKLHMIDSESADTVFIDGEEYLADDEDQRYTLYINARKLISHSTKSKYTIGEIISLLNRMKELGVTVKGNNVVRVIPIFREFAVYEEDDTIEFEFNKNAIEYITEMKDQWITVYSNELRELKGKFMIGLYYYYRKFNKTGFVKVKIDDIKELFQCESYETKEFVRRLKNYADKFSEKIKCKMTVDTEKKGTKTTHIIIKFTPAK